MQTISIGLEKLKLLRGSPRGTMVALLDCGLEVRKFKLLSHYYIQFRTDTIQKCVNPFITMYG